MQICKSRQRFSKLEKTTQNQIRLKKLELKNPAKISFFVIISAKNRDNFFHRKLKVNSILNFLGLCYQISVFFWLAFLEEFSMDLAMRDREIDRRAFIPTTTLPTSPPNQTQKRTQNRSLHPSHLHSGNISYRRVDKIFFCSDFYFLGSK